MKRVKGCLNRNCTEYKKTYYKECDEYCVKCGSKLSYVCKHPKCFKQIPDNEKETCCPVHIAERKDRKEKHGNTLKKVGSRVLAFGGIVLTVGKMIIKKK